jgi:hypothetical protein
LKQLGITLSVANLESYALSQGITKSYQSMTQAEQAILRYNYLLSQTKDDQGDAARTSGEWAGQMRHLQQQFDQIKATIGQGLIMALLPVVKAINSLLERLQELANKFKYLMAVITGQDLNEVFGTNSNAGTAEEDLASIAGYADSASDSVDGIADGMKDAAKDAKAFLMSFDEIHKLQSDNDKSSSSEDDKNLGSTIAVADQLIDPDALVDLEDAEDKINDFKNNLPLSEE